MSAVLRHPFPAWGRAFLLALLLALPAAAAADEAVEIGEVRVVGRTDFSSAEDVGAFTTVIRPTAFDKRNKSAPEILSETVGVDVTDLGGEGELSTVSIRGSSAEQVAVFVDGVRINSALSGAVDFSTIPIEAIDRIEVIRGAASARFGTDAMGGVINIVTKRAAGERAIDLKLTGGSFQTLKTAESWIEPRERWRLVLAHQHRSTAGDYPFKSAPVTMGGQTIGPSRTFTRIHNRSIAEDVLAKVRFDLTETLHLSLSNDFFWTDRQVPGMEIETTVLFPANPLDAEEEIYRTTTALLLDLDRFFVDTLSWQLGATNLFRSDHFTDPTPAIGGPIDVTNQSVAPQVHSRWMHTLVTDPVTLTSIVRGQYRYDHTDDRSPIAGSALLGSHGRQTVAAFVQEELALLQDRLLFIPQGRVEDASDRRWRASWRVGAVGRPAPWCDLKANVGTSFRYPTFSELYYPDQGYLRGNPDLDDERMFAWDAGVIFHPKSFSFEAVYFRHRIDNQILWVPISATTIMPINTFRVDAQGVEATLVLDPIRYFHLDANYTWLDAHFAGSSRRLPGRPEHKANVRVEGRVKPVTLFTDVQYVGSYPVNVANTVRFSDHTAIDVGATLTFGTYFFATMEVKDVTNVQIHDARGFPLPRRSYWVTVGANYGKS